MFKFKKAVLSQRDALNPISSNSIRIKSAQSSGLTREQNYGRIAYIGRIGRSSLRQHSFLVYNMRLI